MQAQGFKHLRIVCLRYRWNTAGCQGAEGQRLAVVVGSGEWLCRGELLGPVIDGRHAAAGQDGRTGSRKRGGDLREVRQRELVQLPAEGERRRS